MGTLALIGLGSNLGDRKANLDRAVASLSETPGIVVRAVSPYHETAPVGGPGGQSAFLNAAARLDTALEPLALLLHLLDLEDRAGRVRSDRWGERVLDLDLLLFGCKRLKTPKLTLPHPRMAVRRFVLAPLAEIAPDVVDLATGRTVAQLLTNLDRRPSYVALDAPPGPTRETLYRHLLAHLSSSGLSEHDLTPRASPEGLKDHLLRTSPLVSDLVRAKVHHLNARFWRQRLGNDCWLVSDFCMTERTIGFEDLSQSPGTDERPNPSRRPTFRLDPWLIRPTFIVVLPGGRIASRIDRDGSQFRSGDVLLYPEARTVEGLAAEVLAACAATRTG